MTKFDCNSSNEQELHSHVAITQPANAIKHHLKRYSGCTGPRQQQMPEASVYGLLQAFQADKSAARLIHALEELAGRLEAAESSSSVDAGLRLQDNRACLDLGNLQLPDPARGPLPLWPNACEHAALQAAVEEASMTLGSTAERRAWRSWALSPQHMVHVVEAAWLLVALFRQGGSCAAAVQAHVCERIQRHHVSAVLSGQEPVKGCSSLWAQALADAACRLLRTAYPAVLELHDPQLQLVLHRQLRLYMTGLLPSDAAAPALRSVQQRAAAAGAAASSGADDTSLAADAASSGSACQRASSCAGGDDDQQQGAARTRRYRHTAQFSSAKPGAAVSCFMAQQGLQPAPEFLQAHAGELTRITLPAQLIQQQQQQQQEAQATDAQHRLQLLRLSAQASTCSATAGSPVPGGAAGSSTETKGPGPRAKAAACMAAASQAVEAYEKRKAAAAAAVKAGSLSAQVAVQALAKQKAKAVALGPSQAKEASNRVSGYLSEAGAATTCLVAKAPAGSTSGSIRSAAAAAGSPARTTPGSPGASSSSRTGVSKPSRGPRAPATLPTDLVCKAQRHVLENTLRAGDWRMAHACSASVAVHDRCTNMAAAVATLPPAPVTPAPPPAAVAMAGQDWGALVSSSVARHHLRGVAAGGARFGMAPSSGSDVKVMKAARAIVEDVLKAFAASGSPPLGGKNRR